MKIPFMKVTIKDGICKTTVGVEEIGPGHPQYAIAQLTQQVAEQNPG